MPLRSIVLVGLRYIALTGVIYAVMNLLCQLGTITAMMTQGVHLQPEVKILALYGVAANAAVSGVLWFLAPQLSRLLCRGDAQSATVNLGGISRLDLYRFATVLTGLWSVMFSLYGVTNWLWSTLVPMSSYVGNRAHDPQQSYYILAGHIVPLLCGLVLLWQSNRLSEWLNIRDTTAETK